MKANVLSLSGHCCINIKCDNFLIPILFQYMVLYKSETLQNQQRLSDIYLIYQSTTSNLFIGIVILKNWCDSFWADDPLICVFQICLNLSHTISQNIDSIYEYLIVSSSIDKLHSIQMRKICKKPQLGFPNVQIQAIRYSNYYGHS